MSDKPPELHQWLIQPLSSEVARSMRKLARRADVAHIALMPDVHLSENVCVGTVMATTHLLYPSAVGGDIGCGMAAMAFDADASVLASETNAARLLSALREKVPSNRHRSPQSLPQLLTEPAQQFSPTPDPELKATDRISCNPCESLLSHPRLEAIKRRDGAVQFATLGGGNHFLEFQTDDAEDGRLWLMLHTGSRAIGQAIRDHHLACAVGRPLPALDSHTPAGQAYLADMDWAVRYAEASRRTIAEHVSQIMRDLFGIAPVESTYFDCHHNFIRAELHDGRSLYVHRKGAIPAAAGEPGIVPGSMGTASFHVEGKGHAPSLNSGAHGAGRAMSRDQARRQITPRDLARQMNGIWFDPAMASALCEEAPAAYKQIEKVLRAQRDLVRVARRLRPMLVYKGR